MDFSRSASGSDSSALRSTCSLKPLGYCLAAAATMTTPRTSSGWSTPVVRATQLPKAWPTITTGWRATLRITAA
ncbi:hypothetical protein G6F65_022172 [Rhizopus arrhizus]|nr:hypothetical protein G6F65_022172 [Rhizopus arrhizus]KAG1373768.1 hypothetical protein G6F59_018468 [Rhizopus arrhizus]